LKRKPRSLMHSLSCRPSVAARPPLPSSHPGSCSPATACARGNGTRPGVQRARTARGAPPLRAAQGDDERPSSGMRNASEAAQQGVAGAMEYSLTELSKRDGRMKGTNLFLVGDSEEQWRKLDEKVNKYPIQRSFTAIGSGGEPFKETMVKAVEEVVGTIHQECISERSSSKGRYLSVTVGPLSATGISRLTSLRNRFCVA